MFEKIPGLDPQRAVRLTALVEQCRPALDQGAGMDAVQRLLLDREIAVMDAILVTRELLGAGPDTLGQAKRIVLTSGGWTLVTASTPGAPDANFGRFPPRPAGVRAGAAHLIHAVV